MLLAGFLTSIILEYVNPEAFFPVIGATKIGTILPYTLLLIVLLRPEPVSNAKLLSHPNTKWLLSLLVLVCLSALHAEVTAYTFDVFRKVLGHIVWYVILVKVATDVDKLMTVFRVLVWSHIISIALNPAVVLEPESRSYLQTGSFLGDGNDFALSVSIVLPICLVLLGVAKTKFRKLVYVGVSTVLILTIIGTQSRGGTLALAGSVLFMWWLSQRRFAGLVAMGITLLIVISFAPPQYFERMETISSYEQESSAMGRIQAWKAAVSMAAKHPVTGVGAGHFPVAIGRESNIRWMTAHSSYFLILGELGIPGLVFIMSLLVGNFVRLRRLRIRTQGRLSDDDMLFHDIFVKLSASLIAFGIGGAFLSATYYPHMFVLSGLITAVTFIYERTIESSVIAETLPGTAKSNARV